MLTYFVLQTFERTPRGILYAEQPREVASKDAAIRAAARLAETKPAVIAFSRTGNPATGDFEDAVILASHGVLPWEHQALLVG